MKHHPKVYLLPLITEHQRITGKRLKDTEYARAIGISRQAFVAMVEGSTSATSNDTLDKLLDFFTTEGLPITVGDLFTVSAETTGHKT